MNTITKSEAQFVNDHINALQAVIEDAKSISLTPNQATANKATTNAEYNFAVTVAPQIVNAFKQVNQQWLATFPTDQQTDKQSIMEGIEILNAGGEIDNIGGLANTLSFQIAYEFNRQKTETSQYLTYQNYVDFTINHQGMPSDIADYFELLNKLSLLLFVYPKGTELAN